MVRQAAMAQEVFDLIAGEERRMLTRPPPLPLPRNSNCLRTLFEPSVYRLQGADGMISHEELAAVHAETLLTNEDEGMPALALK